MFRSVLVVSAVIGEKNLQLLLRGMQSAFTAQTVGFQ